ncbi:MAG TPA: phosphoribosylanthranilate isomerase [Candidatus Dormibacteraeota bacterium]|nr:phosphoribosylanthranilate isomerase [Candidatus Dormibacteraeota bacterium]
MERLTPDPDQMSQLGASPAELGSADASPRTRIKICGCTSASDVALAAAAGADAVGVIFAPSPRQVSIEQARVALADAPAQLSLVGVFVNPSVADLERAVAAIPRLIPQFSGSESAQLCRHLGRPFIRVFPIPSEEPDGDDTLAAHVAEYPDALPVFETASRQGGGSGRTFHWSRVQRLSAQRRVVISGGLSPANVAQCVEQVRPYGVDVRSGVETEDLKDPSKLAAFISAARSSDAAT